MSAKIIARETTLTHLGNACVDGNLFGRLRIGDAHINGLGPEVVDTLGRIALVPGDAEGRGPVLEALLDEGIGQGFRH